MSDSAHLELPARYAAHLLAGVIDLAAAREASFASRQPPGRFVHYVQ